MRRPFWIVPWAAVLFAAPPVAAADLTALDRTLRREPAYQGTPRYCLLAFGPEARARVWLVQDGDTLYVDRDGSGDLTTPGKKIYATPGPLSNPREGEYRFDAGNVADGPRLHLRLGLEVRKLDYLAAENPDVRAALAREPGLRGYYLTVDYERPGWKGLGEGGRVRLAAGLRDVNGLLRFAARPQDAPVIHFGGPLTIDLDRPPQPLAAGQGNRLFLAVGTPGLGPGTSTRLPYPGIVPEGANPVLKYAFRPQHSWGPELERERVQEGERWMGEWFADGIRAPRAAGPGAVDLAISFDAWKEGAVAPSRHRLTVAAPPVPLLPEPVSPRLLRHLDLGEPEAGVGVLHFQPDGRLLAANGRTLQTWDPEAGRRVSRVDLGEWPTHGFLPAPDGRSVYLNRPDQGQQGQFPAVVAWDTGPGLLRFPAYLAPEYQARALSPRGSALLVEEVPSGLKGVFLEDGEIRLPWPRLSLWNPRTGIRRALPASWSHAAFTPDDRAVIGLATDQSGEHATIQLADAATGWVERSIPLPWAPLAAEARVDISPDRRLLLAHTSARDLRMWDLTTGQVTGTWGASVVGDTSRTRVTFAPDGRTVAVVAWKYPPPPKRPPHPGPVIELTGSPSGVPEALPLYLLDTPGLRLRKAVPLPAPFLPVRIAFSPDGRRLAILLQAWPLRAGTHDTYFDVPQPRVQLVDVATGTVAEMLILPPCDPGPLAFSADGQRLATGGHGQILVWDVR